MDSQFEKSLKFLLSGVDDKALYDNILKRLYKYVGTDCVEELSFDFEDNLFLVFYKLAQIENYRNINDEDRMISAEVLLRKQGLKRQVRKTYDGQGLIKETMDIDKARAASLFNARLFTEKPGKALSKKKSMFSLKQIVEHYKGDWALYLTEEKVDREELLSAIKDRIKTAYTPTYERAVEKPNFIEYTAELFDMALEMAVCSYVAHKENQADVAWVALSKAREFLGLYVGVRLKVELNLKKDLARVKKKYTSNLKKEVHTQALLKKLISLRDKSWQVRARDKDEYKNKLITELIPIMISRDFTGFNLTGDEVTVKDLSDLAYEKICNLLDTDLKKVFNELYSLSVTEISIDDKDKEYFYVEKKDYELFQAQLKSVELSQCSNGTNCPRYIQKQEFNKKAERFLKDPLAIK